MTTRTATLMAALVAAAALATPAAAQTDTAAAAVAPAAPAAAAEAPRQRRNPNEITRAQMLEKGARNVYEGIRMIRASWLRASRGLSSSTQQNPVVAVYRDGALVGGISTLHDMEVDSIIKVEYIDPNTAVQRFGSDAAGGAILVHS
ncbi:MAG TPA: hypothetical protein VFS20_27205 [Longimicrobium sp.]|nr:hypothetical protein [Longimicrobium sp.]